MIISQKREKVVIYKIALVSTGALALGIIITSISTGFNIDISNYMFGSILSMTKGDVIVSLILSIAVLSNIYDLLQQTIYDFL